MKATAKSDYRHELTEGIEYDVIAVIETDRAIGDKLVVIADNDENDFGTYSIMFFSSVNIETNDFKV